MNSMDFFTSRNQIFDFIEEERESRVTERASYMVREQGAKKDIITGLRTRLV